MQCWELDVRCSMLEVRRCTGTGRPRPFSLTLSAPSCGRRRCAHLDTPTIAAVAPLPARHERGEGWGEGLVPSNCRALLSSPLPEPTAIEVGEFRQDRSADFSPLRAVLGAPERGGLKSALLNSMTGLPDPLPTSPSWGEGISCGPGGGIKLRPAAVCAKTHTRHAEESPYIEPT